MRLTHTSALCVTLCITGVIDSFEEGDERCTLHNIRIILADLLGLDHDVFTTKPWRRFIKNRVLIHMKARLGLCSPFQASFSNPCVPVETTLRSSNLSEPELSASRRSTNSPSTGSEPTPDPSDHPSRLITPCHTQPSLPTASTATNPCLRVVKTEQLETDSADLIGPTSDSHSHIHVRPATQSAHVSELRDLEHDPDASVSMERTEARVNSVILDVCRRMETGRPKPVVSGFEGSSERKAEVKVEIKREPKGHNMISESDHDCESNHADDSDDDEETSREDGQDQTFRPGKTRSDKRKLQDTLSSEEQDQRSVTKRQWTSETRPKTRTCTTQEEIKRLKRLIYRAGIKKHWAKEFRGKELDLKWQLCRLQAITHDIRTRQPPYTLKICQKLRSLERAARKAERGDSLSELDDETSKIGLSSLSRASLAGPEKATNVKNWKGWRYIMVDDEGNELPDVIWEAPAKQIKREEEVGDEQGALVVKGEEEVV